MTNTSQPTSVLRELRSLMPPRVLTYLEALQRAELQATRLLSLQDVTTWPVPPVVAAGLPRIRVEYEWDIPASGSAAWVGGAWEITLNAAEHPLRQRFSLFHELKHIIDHPTRHLIQGDRQHRLSAEDMAERVADYFAACVLMPKAWVKSAYCRGTQSTEALAQMFHVSPMAMSVRLSQLGLSADTNRCDSSTFTRHRRTTTYWRSAPAIRLLQGVAA